MVINFMKFEDEDALRQTLEQLLKIGSATVDDVLLFCNENKLTVSEPIKIRPDYPEYMRKHEVAIFCRTRALSGAREFFKLSNWKNILKKFFLLWTVFFWIVEWGIAFYFDNNILTEIYVSIDTTSF